MTLESNSINFKETPSQTAGPFLHIGLLPQSKQVIGSNSDNLKAAATRRIKNESFQEIHIRGFIFDGKRQPIKDGLVEIWQADGNGVYNSYFDKRNSFDNSFCGWGRAECSQSDGMWEFSTIKPGPVPFSNGCSMAPHISFWIIARGLNLGLSTRMYFEDEAKKNHDDPVLTQIKELRRRDTLIAKREKADHYLFNIYLQGEDETIFFDI